MNIKKLQSHNAFSESSLFRYAGFTLFLYCFCFPLSIALTQILLISFMVFVLVALLQGKRSRGVYYFIEKIPEGIKDFYLPIFFWVLVSFVSIPLSLDPARSFKYLMKFSIYLFLPFAVYCYLSRPTKAHDLVFEVKKLIHAMCGGLAIAAVHTILSSHIGFDIKPKVPGPLTESGQIVLILPLLMGSLYLLLKEGKTVTIKQFFSLVCFMVPMLVAFSWYRKVPFMNQASGLVFGLLTVLSFFLYMKKSKRSGFDLEKLIPLLAILIFVAFLLNLKRGPWFAGVIEVILFGLLFSRSLMLGFLCLMFFFSLAPPVYDRLASFAEHFFIGGGRFDMWKLGIQMIERFPMGVGFANSNVMRDFDPSLPFSHRHMHNNFMNIALETGLLGVVAYIWWFFSFVYKGFMKVFKTFGTIKHATKEAFYVVLLLLSLIGWQLAGIVEYNFGDSEIRLLAFVLSGFLFALFGEFGKNQKSKNSLSS